MMKYWPRLFLVCLVAVLAAGGASGADVTGVCVKPAEIVPLKREQPRNLRSAMPLRDPPLGVFYRASVTGPVLKFDGRDLIELPSHLLVDGKGVPDGTSVPDGAVRTIPIGRMNDPIYARAPDGTILGSWSRLHRYDPEAREYRPIETDRPLGRIFSLVWSDSFGAFLAGSEQGVFRLDHRHSPVRAESTAPGAYAVDLGGLDAVLTISSGARYGLQRARLVTPEARAIAIEGMPPLFRYIATLSDPAALLFTRVRDGRSAESFVVFLDRTEDGIAASAPLWLAGKLYSSGNAPTLHEGALYRLSRSWWPWSFGHVRLERLGRSGFQPVPEASPDGFADIPWHLVRASERARHGLVAHGGGSDLTIQANGHAFAYRPGRGFLELATIGPGDTSSASARSVLGGRELLVRRSGRSLLWRDGRLHPIETVTGIDAAVRSTGSHWSKGKRLLLKTDMALWVWDGSGTAHKLWTYPEGFDWRRVRLFWNDPYDEALIRVSRSGGRDQFHVVRFDRPC